MSGKKQKSKDIVGSVGAELIDPDRLFTDLIELGKIGYMEGKGISRRALSDNDMSAREWLRKRMEDAGLEVRVDFAFNMIGTLRSKAKKDSRVLAIGSHLDTVPQGGAFDGSLGILTGLECARALQEKGIDLPWDMEIINFTDEEGAHNAGTVGSRAMMGLLQEGEIYVSKTKGIPSFAEELKSHGGDPSRISDAVRDLSAFKAFLELHIEQGNRLEAQKIPIGVVTGIVGICRYIVNVRGEASHAGTTPMHLRDDALVKAAPLFMLLPQWLRARNREMVGTIGEISIEPGATNVVPGECACIVELRSMDAKDMVAIRELIVEWTSSHPGSSVATIYEKDSVTLAEDIIEIICQAAQSEGLSYIRMPSGAGHDSQSFAPYVPTGMIFIPCRQGKSHCPEEWAEPKDVAIGCRVLLRTILQLALQSGFSEKSTKGKAVENHSGQSE